LMAKVKSSGNAATELRLIAIFRTHGITGWRRGLTLRPAAPRPLKPPRASATSKPAAVTAPGSRFDSPKPRPFQVRPDFVFTRLKLAVFVDGCFWHGCPLHATQPKQNAEFWRLKIAANQARDRLVTRTLRARGWRVLRLWEHALQPRHAPRLLARLRRAGLAASAPPDHITAG
jgi:DNA mismatch endonuclease (patch repair protein)